MKHGVWQVALACTLVATMAPSVLAGSGTVVYTMEIVDVQLAVPGQCTIGGAACETDADCAGGANECEGGYLLTGRCSEDNTLCSLDSECVGVTNVCNQNTHLKANAGDVFALDYFMAGWDTNPNVRFCSETPATQCNVDTDCIGVTNVCDEDVDNMGSYQIAVDGSSLKSGDRGEIGLHRFPCLPDDIPVCFGRSPCSAFGFCNCGASLFVDESASTPCAANSDCPAGDCVVPAPSCSQSGSPCFVNTDCPIVGEVCEFSTGGFCERGDYVFNGFNTIAAVECSSEVVILDGNFALGAAELSVAGAVDFTDVVGPRYAGSIVLTLSADACGTFTVGFHPSDAQTFSTNTSSANLPADLTSNIEVVVGCLIGSPETCTVDHLIPTEVDNAAAKLGFDVMRITWEARPADPFNTNTFGGNTYFKRTAPGLPGFLVPGLIGITEVSTSTFDYQLGFPIPAGTYFCIRLQSDETQEICVGALPGDVDSSGETNVDDILALLDILIMGTQVPLLDADIDRSGEIGPGDLTMLLNLLNGGGAFISWDAKSISSGGVPILCPPPL